MIKVIDGIAKKVSRHVYNGKVHERVYPIDSIIPEDVRVVGEVEGKAYNPRVHDHIVNQEFAQYAYHFGTH
jgi:hypothetical protein